MILSGSWRVKWLLMLMLYASCSVHLVVSTDAREFCQWETFEESCGNHDVILVQDAVYGRMAMGRCVEKSFGHIGCGVDVLPVMDRECSGRHHCEFSVTTLHGGRHNCPNDLTAYLSISYSCIRVNQCEQLICQNSDFLRLTSNEGYLASAVTSSNGCGSSTCPWQIQAKPGQTVNLTLWTFGGGRYERQRPSSVCRKLATIREAGRSRDLTDCSEPRARGTLVYSSESHLVEVQLHTVEDEGEFFVKYEVVGCPELDLPPHTIVERDGDTVTVRCVDEVQNDPSAPWNLTCRGNSWLGEMGYCQGPETKAVSLGSMFGTTRSSTFGVVVVVGLGVALGVVIGVLMLSITLLYMRRRNRSQNSKLLVKQRAVLLPSADGNQNRPGKRDPAFMEGSPLTPLDADVISRVSTDYLDHDYTSTLRGQPPQPPVCVDLLYPHPSIDVPSVGSEKGSEFFGYHQRDHVYETPSMPVSGSMDKTQHCSNIQC